jgi:hypothetical protein
MYADQTQMLAKKKQTASIVCIVAAALLGLSLLPPLPWLKASSRRGDASVTMSLLTMKACVGDECESLSNFKLAKKLKESYERSLEFSRELRESGDNMPSPKEPKTLFPILGLITLVVCVVAFGTLMAAGVLGLTGRFITQPIALSSVALIASGLALILGCVFVATKPDIGMGGSLGVSWPFFIFGIAVVGAVAGVQMLSKAFGPPEYDPYADPMAPAEPPM